MRLVARPVDLMAVQEILRVMYHLILGIVIGSTVAIFPFGINGNPLLVGAGLAVLGAAASYGLAKLDEKYAREDLFS